MTERESDALCVEQCLRGDVDAFGEIVERYQRPVFSAILHMVGDEQDARELSQQVFMKAFQNLRGYDPDRKFFSWIYRMAINEAINHVKARRPSEPLSESIVDREATPAERLESAERVRQVRVALLGLEPKQRAVIVTRHFLHLSYAEAAEMLGVPEKTVKSRLFDARRRLRETLEANGYAG